MATFGSNSGERATASRRKKRTVAAVMISIALHVAFIFAAISLTILIITPKNKVMFEGKKMPSLPARKLEHAIRVKQMQKQSRKPQILQRLVTEAPSKVALPEMPEMRTPDIRSLRDTPLLNARAGSMGGIGAGGGGAGRGLTGGMGYSDTQFFGENVRTRSVCICMDISPSMVKKGVVQEVTDEAAAMLEKLNVNTRFNLVVFVDGGDAFSPQMVFATQENRKAALAWLRKGFDPRRDGQMRGASGSTPVTAVTKAVEMGAETIFVLSDDPPWLEGRDPKEYLDEFEKYVRGIEGATGKPVKLYPILYKPHQNEKGKLAREYYKRLARATGGRLQVVDDR